METRLVKRLSRSPWARYGLAVVAPVVALLIRVAIVPVVGDKIPYMTFLVATAASAMYGGYAAGAVTTLLGALLAYLFAVLHFGSLAFADADYAALALFVTTGAVISYLGGRAVDATLHENALRILCQSTLVSIGDAVISTDDEKCVRLMNPVAESLTGWTEAEAKGKPIADVFRIVEEGTQTPATIPIDAILETGKAVSLTQPTELISKTGKRIPIDDSGAPILDDRGLVAGVVLVFRDSSLRRQAERELIAAEKRARTILESISDGFILLDHEWRHAQVNSAAERIMGVPAGSLIGKNHWEEYPATVGTQVETLYRKAVADGEAVHLENYYEPWDRWFDISAYPSAEGLALYFRDITERKRSEAAARRASEDLKQFTVAATHDVREPLRMISVYVALLERRLGDHLDEQAKTFMTYVVKGAQRISRLIDGLGQFSRVGEFDDAEPSIVDSDAALREALEDLQIAIAEAGADISYDHLPLVAADHTHLCQLFQNLVGNGLKYSKPNSRPKIHISVESEGPLYVFAVKDNGIGIPPQHQAKIFLPFKRLHGAEIAGAGIGLATCKRIVERYGGTLWVESIDGEGSTFYFSLPAAEGPVH